MITSLEDKKGGIGCLSSEDQTFKEVMEQLCSIDTIPSEGRFTWSNKRGGKHHIAERLNKFLVSETFYQNRQAIGGEIGPFYRSDHWPVSLRWSDGLCPLPKPFRFEKF